MPATYEPIATSTLTSNAGIITFSSIPQTYTDLILIVSARVTTATYDITAIRVNSVTTNYSKTYLQGNGSGVTSGRATAEISLRGGYLPGTNYSSQYSADTYHFMNYSNSTTNKTVLCRMNFVNSPADFNVQAQVSLIPTTSAITQITFQTANGANLATGSTFTLYGIKAA